MPDIDWLVCLADTCPGLGTACPPGFLSQSEYEMLAGLSFPKRRREWLLGRWTAKHLLRCSHRVYQSLSLDSITVGNDPDGAPYLDVTGEGRLAMSLSISHRQNRAFCALSPTVPPSIGADIEGVEPRDPAFVHDFFTEDEDRRVWACPPTRRDTLVTAIWSAKESVLKALRHGLRVDTRSVEVHHIAGIERGPSAAPWPPTKTWHPVQVRCTLPDCPHLRAWWQPLGNCVLTIAVLEPSPTLPGYPDSFGHSMQPASLMCVQHYENSQNWPPVL